MRLTNTDYTLRRAPPRVASLIVALLILPLLTTLIEPLSQALPSAQAASSDCSVDTSDLADWTKEVSSFNITPLNWEDNEDEMEPWFGWWDIGGDGYNDDYELRALRKDFHASFLVQNDTTSGIRLNLTTGYRYTVCIVAHSLNYLDAPKVDFYLLQQYDWGMYKSDFQQRNDEFRELLNSISPEWRDVAAWMPYRDVHSYEGRESVDFTVSLDHDETSGEFFGMVDPEPEWMYILVDGWDNMRDSDTPAPHRNFSVDISIMTEPRITLPSYTVSLFCCGLFLALIAAPVIAHSRFSSAGLEPAEGADQGVEIMPMLEQEATKELVPIHQQKPPPPSG